MNEKNINKSSSFLHVLIAPLDWGLGHATRCIPIIHELQKENITVFVAADGAILNLLQKEFPKLIFLPLQGYNISYPKKNSSFVVKLLLQVPRILATIRRENKWLKKMIREHSINAVISDNRFGLYNNQVKTVYITHQLHIETNNNFLNKLAQKIHYRYINRYSECWVPDSAGKENLAGKLSHPRLMPVVPVKYLGPLSRFKKITTEKNTDLLILLSGPEPQRTFLEELILQQVESLDLSVVCVRGLPNEKKLPDLSKNNIRFYNHLPADELSALIQQSSMLICRSGYSTVMDLAAIQQKAILVPTPGQTEQEYLAGYLQQKNFFLSAPQKELDLKVVLKRAAGFGYQEIPVAEGGLKEIVTTFLNKLRIAVR